MYVIILICMLLAGVTAAPISPETKHKSDPISRAALKASGGDFKMQASISQPLVGSASGKSWTLRPGHWEIKVPETDSIAAPPPPIVYSFELSQNHPNPFNFITSITFTVPGLSGTTGLTRLAIYDVCGRLVRLLLNDALPAGPHQVIWNGTNERGGLLGSGLYFFQIQIANHFVTKKLVILK